MRLACPKLCLPFFSSLSVWRRLVQLFTSLAPLLTEWLRCKQLWRSRRAALQCVGFGVHSLPTSPRWLSAPASLAHLCRPQRWGSNGPPPLPGGTARFRPLCAAVSLFWLLARWWCVAVPVSSMPGLFTWSHLVVFCSSSQLHSFFLYCRMATSASAACTASRRATRITAQRAFAACPRTSWRRVS